MSKKQVNARVPGDLEEILDEYSENNDVSDAEAARQLLRRGANTWRQGGPGETLAQQATAISAVVGLVPAVMFAFGLGPTWTPGAALAGAASTLLFGVFWLGVRALAGRGDFV